MRAHLEVTYPLGDSLGFNVKTLKVPESLARSQKSYKFYQEGVGYIRFLATPVDFGYSIQGRDKEIQHYSYRSTDLKQQIERLTIERSELEAQSKLPAEPLV